MAVLPQINTFGWMAEFARVFRVRFAAELGVRGEGASWEFDLVGEPGRLRDSADGAIND